MSSSSSSSFSPFNFSREHTFFLRFLFFSSFFLGEKKGQAQPPHNAQWFVCSQTRRKEEEEEGDKVKAHSLSSSNVCVCVCGDEREEKEVLLRRLVKEAN